MDYTQIITLIANIGFPAVFCIILFKTQNDEREAHREEISQLRTSYEANTQILTELKTLINERLKDVKRN